MTHKVKLFLTDFDGVLTDGHVYYDEKGNITKKFHVHDGMGLAILKRAGITTGLITSDTTSVVEMRAEHIGFSYVEKGKDRPNKLITAKEICRELGISLDEVSYMGDDINCHDLLSAVGYPACPADAQEIISSISGIHITKKAGGKGAVREWIDYLDNNKIFALDKSILNIDLMNKDT